MRRVAAAAAGVPLMLIGMAPIASAVTRADIILTTAGTGEAGFGGDGGAATSAVLTSPIAVAADAARNRYIADTGNNRIRKVDPSGRITTIAGNGIPGYTGDGGPATLASLDGPNGVAVDPAGNVYIADTWNHRVRKIDRSGTITTVAGNGAGTGIGSVGDGYGGDGGPAILAQLDRPTGVALDATGNLYIADSFNNRIRMVDGSGSITTVAGDGRYGDGGDGGLAIDAQLRIPQAVAVDGVGNLYIADTGNNRVRRVDASGTISTVAGNGAYGYGGDGGPAPAALLAYPSGVAVDAVGTLYVADTFNHRVRVVDASGTITTLAGSVRTGVAGDGGPAGEALLHLPHGLASSPSGVLYVADSEGHRVRQVGADALWAVNADGPDPASVGEPLTYSVQVVNGSPAPLAAVSVTDHLDPQLRYRSVSATQGSCVPHATAKGTKVVCSLGTLSAGGRALVEITVVPTVHTLGLVNRAVVRAKNVTAVTATATTAISAAGCGRVVTESVVLAADIGPCAGDGIRIGADGVRVDLGGHRVFGYPGPSGPEGDAAGIRLEGRTGVTVTNGVVSDFDAGVAVLGGGSNILSGLTLRDNIGPDDVFTATLGDGIFIEDSAGNRVVGNTVTHNGIFDGIGIFGPEADGNVVEDNLVEDTVGPSDGGPAGQGIVVNGASGRVPTTVSSTLVAGNVVRGNASAGIANVNHVGGTIVGNTVVGNGGTNSLGNGIGVSAGPNLTAPTEMLIQGNEVHGNGVDGIRIATRATGNRVLDNNAANNNANPGVNWYEGGADNPGFDLHDWNAGCDGNTWSGNTWGTGGYDPPCTADGGSGPPFAPPAPEAAVAADDLNALDALVDAWTRFLDRGRL